jgi:transposase-like protein
MEEFNGANLPVAEIARRVGVSVPTIYQWKRRLGLEGTRSAHEESGQMVRVIAANWPTATVKALPGAPGTVSLVFASGLVCRVEPDFDERTLLRLVNLLAATHD